MGGEDGGVWVDCDQVALNVVKCRVFSEDGSSVLQAGEYRSRQKLEPSDLAAFDGNTLLTRNEVLSYKPGLTDPDSPPDRP